MPNDALEEEIQADYENGIITLLIPKKELEEIEEGIIPDPNAPVDPATGAPMDPGTSEMDLGQPVMEPDVEAQAKTVEVPKGGEI